MQIPRLDRRQALALAAISAAAVGSSACSLLPRTPEVPMRVVRIAGPCTAGAAGAAGAAHAGTLVVMLPGAYSPPSEFVSEGFVDALRRNGGAADVVIADAHLGYFYDRSILARLRQDVIAPARAAGYRHIWLVGISLGGFGALGYGARHGEDIDGIVALAPYVGRRALLREITEAGGATAWPAQAQARPREADDLEFEVWQWLAAPPAGAPPVYLGFGRDDRLAEGHHLLATILDADRVTQVPGGHDWPPWLALWQRWLARGLLTRDCKPRAA